MMNLYESTFQEYKAGVMGYSALAIIVQSGIGSIAVMLVNMSGNSLLEACQFMLIAILCMFYNASVLSQQKPRLTFNFLLISIIASVLMIIFKVLTLWG